MIRLYKARVDDDEASYIVVADSMEDAQVKFKEALTEVMGDSLEDNEINIYELDVMASGHDNVFESDTY